MQSDTAVLDRAVNRSVRHLMPWLLLMYVFAYLDRTNIGFAKNALQAATGIDEYAYAWGAGILSIGYCLVEIPSNLAMRRFGALERMVAIPGTPVPRGGTLRPSDAPDFGMDIDRRWIESAAA
jgi:hypothetical protein